MAVSLWDCWGCHRLETHDAGLMHVEMVEVKRCASNLLWDGGGGADPQVCKSSNILRTQFPSYFAFTRDYMPSIRVSKHMFVYVSGVCVCVLTILSCSLLAVTSYLLYF